MTKDKGDKRAARATAGRLGITYAAARGVKGPRSSLRAGPQLLRAALGLTAHPTTERLGTPDGPARVVLSMWAGLAAMAVVLRPGINVERHDVTIDYRKWPARPLRRYTGVSLGSDGHGHWIGVPAGTPVYRGTTRSGTADWPFVALIPHEGWWMARHFQDGGWKIDIATPATWHDLTVVQDDLDLDVRRLHGRVWIEDQDEFDERVTNGMIPPAETEAALDTARVLEAALTSNIEPFAAEGDRRLAQLAARTAASSAAVLFDMGGVITVGSTHEHERQWENALGLAEGDIARAQQRAIGGGWEAGRGPPEILDAFAAELHVSTHVAEQIVADTHHDTVLDTDLISWIHENRSDGVRVAVVSNNGPDVRRHWEASLNLSNRVDLIVVSGEERVAKPHPNIYLAAANRLGVEPSDCVFVDDNPICVEGAIRVGMAGVHHRASQRTIEELDRFVNSRTRS